MTSPARIGPYRIERLLGVGSFATVWLGHDPVLDSRVAIKVLAENWHHDLRVRERFLDEARLLRRLDDERLVRVHAVGELADGRPYAVLAWADGGSLRDRLAAGPVPAPAALDLLAEIAAGVAVLHRHGVVHRDLAPGNVLFRSGPDGERVLVADLGLAKELAAASGLTARAGTPGYMAPEQNDPLAVVDARADVYGLGRLGVRLLGADAERVAGGQPHAGGAIRLREGVSPQVTAVLRRATAPRPEDRYPGGRHPHDPDRGYGRASAHRR
ncbi:serine/threonine-protein kinase, partial [Micromonospora sp. NPDC000018]|uniref:serine/threonine-protein kinase n=1 Tax=Micromonospora sp. NPDC000018 TaxID=3154239 RepID=UPI0033309AF7